MTTLWEEFAANAARHPDKVAIVSHRVANGEKVVVTYGELTQLAERFAAALVELGVERGEVVSFQLPNWWEVAALHLACVRIGAVANPIITILRAREVEEDGLVAFPTEPGQAVEGPEQHAGGRDP